ncbi:MAG: tRNA pseudouridine(55) synthase TruB [Mollicutes bacterium PWAP]|nr:tRNA pseudouridine(55) synthase TruB [Mollicutes bacterium PWAP]
MFKLLYKNKGITSFKFINKWARENNIKKIGHTGTLDPMATGLMIVATDDDTRLINYINKDSKNYKTTMKFGLDSNTLDSDGEVIQKKLINLSDIELLAKINSFVKTYNQIPPNFSAKKINGKRAYELARENKVFQLRSSEVTIDKIWNIEINYPNVTFEVRVSHGTYIRSLIRDIAHSLNTFAIMAILERTEVHRLSLDRVDEEINPKELIDYKFIKIKDIKKLIDGKSVNVIASDGEYIVEYNDDLVGFVCLKNNEVIKRKLFGNKLKGVK